MPSHIKIEKPRTLKRRKFPLIFTFFISLLAIGAAAYYYFYTKPYPYDQLEISNFVGKPEIYTPGTGSWKPAERSQSVEVGQRIRTGPGAEVDLYLEEGVRMRLKENSELHRKGKFFYDIKGEQSPTRLYLKKGRLLAATEKTKQNKLNPLQLSTPNFYTKLLATSALVESNIDEKFSKIGILRGKAVVNNNEPFKKDQTTVLGSQQLEIRDGIFQQPTKITREEWEAMKEAYELIQKSAAMEARQLDLSKLAGNFFEYVFDHGTFYTPKIGFADREFIQEVNNNEVYLEVTYDVFPRGSYVGVYIKTRDFDLSKFEALEFQVKRKEDESFPEAIRIELKGKEGLARVFTPKNFTNVWKTEAMTFQASKPTDIREIAIVFTHEKAGGDKKGSLLFKNFNLIPKKIEPLPDSSVMPEIIKIPATPPTTRQIPGAEGALPIGNPQTSEKQLAQEEAVEEFLEDSALISNS